MAHKVFVGIKRPQNSRPKRFAILICILFSVILSVTATPRQIECILNENGLCQFIDVQLTRDDYNFEPISERVNFTGVQFINSSIPILGSDVCDTFPFIQEFRIGNSQLETILPEALENCGEIWLFQAHQNQIKELHWATFRHNTKLEMIYMPSNLLKTIDFRTFRGLKQLNRLDVQSNYLEKFDPEWLKESKNLSSITIYSNELTTFDAESIIELYPKMEIILYDSNLISCVRVEQINVALRAARIEFPALGYRPRYHEVREIDGIDCVPDESWAGAHYRQKAEQQPSSVKLDKWKLDEWKLDLVDGISELLDELNK